MPATRWRRRHGSQDSRRRRRRKGRLRKETIVKEKHTCVKEVYDGRYRYRDGKAVVGEARKPGIGRESIGNEYKTGRIDSHWKDTNCIRSGRANK